METVWTAGDGDRKMEPGAFRTGSLPCWPRRLLSSFCTVLWPLHQGSQLLGTRTYRAEVGLLGFIRMTVRGQVDCSPWNHSDLSSNPDPIIYDQCDFGQGHNFFSIRKRRL